MWSWPSGQPGTKEKHVSHRFICNRLEEVSKKDTSLPEILCRTFGALPINELNWQYFLYNDGYCVVSDGLGRQK